MKEIKDWLEKPEKDFNEGLSLFQKYSKNRSVFLYLLRKADMSKLEYELSKLAKYDNLKVIGLPKPFLAKRKFNLVADETHKILQARTIKREDLPEELQKVYDEITEDYKLQRVFHEKMKLAKTDEARTDLRKEVVELDDRIASHWKLIDEAVAGSKDSGVKDTPAETHKVINSARVFISRAIKNYKPENRDKILERVETLIRLKAPVKSDTRAKLIELNVIENSSNLLGQ